MVKHDIREKTTEIILDAINSMRDDWKDLRVDSKEDTKVIRDTLGTVREELNAAWRNIKKNLAEIAVIKKEIEQYETLQKDYSKTKDKLLSINKDLYDNGNPGIFTKFQNFVEENETELDRVKKIMYENKRWIDNKKSNWRLTMVYGTVLVTILGLSATIIGLLLK